MSIVNNSASMETVNESTTSVFGCMNKIQHALKNHDVYESNYQYFMNSPIVMKLKRSNAKLRNQNKEYKMIIHELTSKLDNTTKKKRVYEEVKIKTEPVNLNTSQKEVLDLVDDDDEVIILENNTKPNIMYEIIDELDEEDTNTGEEVKVKEEAVDEEEEDAKEEEEEEKDVKEEEDAKEEEEEEEDAKE